MCIIICKYANILSKSPANLFSFKHPIHKNIPICKAHTAKHKANLAKEYVFCKASGHTLLRWTHIFNSKHQDEGRTYNIGIAKMQADASRVSTVVTLFSHISSLTLSI